ncbi:hypothetical protein CTI12_AA571230 [Artemisia annua]|uniref:Uncharacterized protein n=1 Tax=Artemisia annua TaxID=35608 RepID=A0A2U1KS23_ARTAN|nr:hypothetical protein CTI12_AA571230 [Artemisia annua]
MDGDDDDVRDQMVDINGKVNGEDICANYIDDEAWKVDSDAHTKSSASTLILTIFSKHVVVRDGGAMIDLTIRRGGKRPVQRIDVQTVEQFQKRKPGRQPTTHTIYQPSDHSRLLPIQETSVVIRPGGQTIEKTIHSLQDNQMAPRPRGHPRNDSTKKPKQPIYAGDIQSDVHSSKRISERLKQKTKLSRLKISQGGFVRPTWVGDENDPRTNTFVGISRDYIDHGNTIYKCGDCNALLWQSESMVGSTHKVNGSYSLCCGRGKVMLTNEIVNPLPLLLDLISGNNPKSSLFIDNIWPMMKRQHQKPMI